VRIVFCGDSGGRVLSRITRLVSHVDPELIVFAGDTTPDAFGVGRRRRRRWLGTWGALADRLVTVPGNHDYGSRTASPFTWHGRWGADDRFQKRRGDGAFLLAHHEVTVLGLDTGARAMRVDASQMLWARSALSATDPRASRIAVLHSPAFPTSRHIGSSLDADPRSRDLLWEMLEDEDFGLVVTGHEHLYARRTIHRRRPIVQVTVGGAGATLTPPIARDIDAAVAAHHVLIADAGPDRLVAEARSLDDLTLDNFEIRRPPEGPADNEATA
jgi:predicted phosphodiesterase